MAWTVVETLHDSKLVRNNEHINCIKLVMTGDGGASDYDLSSTLKDYWQGSVLYLVKIVPGTGDDVPGGTFNLDIEDDTNAHILDTDTNPADATTFKAGSTTISVAPPVMTTLSVVCADIGTGNKITVYLYFWK
jgi:hypothetical protein